MAVDVRLTISADDQSAAALQVAGQNIQGLGTSAVRAMSGFDALARGVQGMANALQSGFTIMTRLDLTQITLQQSTERVTQAQKDLTRAVAENGLASQQSIDAQLNLEAAQANLEKTQLRARLSQVLVTGEIAIMISRIPAAVTGLAAMTAGWRGVATAAGAAAATQAGATAVATGGASVVATLAAIAVVAAATTAAMYGLNAALDGSGKSSTAAASDLEELRKRLEDAKKRQAEYNEELKGEGEWRSSNLYKLDQWVRGHVAWETSVKEGRKAVDDEVETLEELAAAGEVANRNLAFLEATTGVDALGISLKNLPTTAQVELLRNLGVTDAAGRVGDTFANLEAALGDSVGRTRQQILDQVSATRLKGETTAEMNARLGITVELEAEFEAQGRYTTEGIITQAEATKRAADEQRGLASATEATLTGWQKWKATMASREGGGSGGGGSPIGVGLPSNYDPVTGSATWMQYDAATDSYSRVNNAHITLGGHNVASSRFGSADVYYGTPGAALSQYGVNVQSALGPRTERTSTGRPAPDGLDVAREEFQAHLARNPGARGNADVDEYFRFLEGPQNEEYYGRQGANSMLNNPYYAGMRDRANGFIGSGGQGGGLQATFGDIILPPDGTASVTKNMPGGQLTAQISFKRTNMGRQQ